MNIDRYHHQHADIRSGVSQLRNLVQGGIAANAEAIAQALIGMSTTIKFHLASEDAMLYPALNESSDRAVAELGRRYQNEMQGLIGSYTEFSGKWRVASQIAAAPEQFRSEANVVFKALHGRIQREDQELYPAVEAL